MASSAFAQSNDFLRDTDKVNPAGRST